MTKKTEGKNKRRDYLDRGNHDYNNKETKINNLDSLFKGDKRKYFSGEEKYKYAKDGKESLFTKLKKNIDYQIIDIPKIKFDESHEKLDLELNFEKGLEQFEKLSIEKLKGYDWVSYRGMYLSAKETFLKNYDFIPEVLPRIFKEFEKEVRQKNCIEELLVLDRLAENEKEVEETFSLISKIFIFKSLY